MMDPKITTNNFLLAISIGPVQDFIKASRKARDLWAGSDLLSDLSWTAANALRDSGDTELIYPSLPADDVSADVAAPQPNCANKLLIHIEGGDPREKAAVAHQAAVEKLRWRWDRMLSGSMWEAIDTDLGKRQLEDFIEWYAAWISFDPAADASQESSYPSRRLAVERLLAGRKALRDFLPAAGIDGRPKSSLDPARESVVRHDLIRTFDATRQQTIQRTLRLKGNEQLDGISLLKRLVGQNRLVSVSRVAVDPLIRRMSQDGFTQDLTTLRDSANAVSDTEFAEHFATAGGSLQHYEAFPYDCQLFYAEDVKVLDTADLTGEQYEQVASFLNTAQAVAAQLRQPPAYFVVLVADGDRMGKALSELTSLEHHKIFSSELNSFADSAGEIVSNHSGVMIYSGGDDVLAFLPLDLALPCAHALKHGFDETIDIIWQALAQSGATLPSIRPTLSVGLAIGHYAEHLQVLLERGRDAEKAAKVNRNSLAVSFSAHSGGGDTRTVTHSWAEDPVRERWWFAIDALRLDAIPDGAVYELARLRQELAPVSRGFDNAPLTLVYDEAIRVINRKRTEHGRKKVPSWMAEALRERLALAAEAPPESTHDEDSVESQLERNQETLQKQLDALQLIVDELYIARRILPAILLGDRSAFEKWEEPIRGPGVSLRSAANELEAVLEEVVA